MEPIEGSHGVNLLPLLKSGRFSDLQVSCEGHEFAVHKSILCTQSRVVNAECEGGFEVCPVLHGLTIEPVIAEP